MVRRARVLLVEDRVSDAELVLRQLRHVGIDPEHQRVEDEAAYRATLADGWDLIIADFDLPQFDALRALTILKESQVDIPFILVSGTIGEQVAIDSMNGGASDYIFKNNLARLGAVAVRELDGLDRRRAAAAEHKEADALTSAHLAVSRALAGTEPLDVVLMRALQAIGDNLGWDVAQVWVPDESGSALHCRSQWVRPALRAAELVAAVKGDRYRRHEGLVGRVWAESEPIWIEDISHADNAALAVMAKYAGLTSAALVPLLAGSQFIGVGQFFSRQRHPADGALLQFNVRLGGFIARAMGAAALMQSESRFNDLFFDTAVGQALIRLPDGTVLNMPFTSTPM